MPFVIPLLISLPLISALIDAQAAGHVQFHWAVWAIIIAIPVVSFCIVVWSLFEILFTDY